MLNQQRYHSRKRSGVEAFTTDSSEIFSLWNFPYKCHTILESATKHFSTATHILWCIIIWLQVTPKPNWMFSIPRLNFLNNFYNNLSISFRVIQVKENELTEEKLTFSTELIMYASWVLFLRATTMSDTYMFLSRFGIFMLSLLHLMQTVYNQQKRPA